jgi:hypothetical protein
VQPDAGTYTSQIHIAGKMVGQDGHAAVTLNCTNGVTISTTGQDALQAYDGAVIELVGGCIFQTATSGACMSTNQPGSLIIINGNLSVACAGQAFNANNQSEILYASGTITVASGGTGLLIANQMGALNFQNAIFSFSTSVTFTQTAQAQLNSWLNVAGATWTLNAHTVTGKCHVAQFNGIVETDGASLTFCSSASAIPGSTTVTVSNQGIYF